MTNIVLLAALAIAWLTAVAMLCDTRPDVRQWRGAATALWRAAVVWAAAGRHGWRLIDAHALSRAVRPPLRVVVLVLIVGTSMAGSLELMQQRAPGGACALLTFALAVWLAMQTPCPWLRWVLLGDRRKAQLPHHEPERRQPNAD